MQLGSPCAVFALVLLNTVLVQPSGPAASGVVLGCAVTNTRFTSFTRSNDFPERSCPPDVLWLLVFATDGFLSPESGYLAIFRRCADSLGGGLNGVHVVGGRPCKTRKTCNEWSFSAPLEPELGGVEIHHNQK